MKDMVIVDSLTVTILVDNVIEWSGSEIHENVLSSSQWVKEKEHRSIYMHGGHGLSFFIQTRVGDSRYEILYDTGPSGELLLHNLKALNLDISSIDAIVMSHGHWDHFGGLLDILRKVGRKDVLIYLHPKMLNPRRTVNQSDEGKKINKFPLVPTLGEIEASGGKPILTADPVLLAGKTILRTGEIPRLTEYETGFPNHQMLVDDMWIDDSMVIDDNCLGIRTSSGIVIVTGCAHSGAVNSVKEIIRLTGEEDVRAIIGGFHLMGKRNISQIKKTISGLKEFNPSMIVPCHCTGAPAQHFMAHELSDAFVTGSVGNRYVF